MAGPDCTEVGVAERFGVAKGKEEKIGFLTYSSIKKVNTSPEITAAVYAHQANSK